MNMSSPTCVVYCADESFTDAFDDDQPQVQLHHDASSSFTAMSISCPSTRPLFASQTPLTFQARAASAADWMRVAASTAVSSPRSARLMACQPASSTSGNRTSGG
jgi:hypothetical protein